MKKRKKPIHQHLKTTQSVNEPEIISLQELQDQEKEERLHYLKELEKTSPQVLGEQSAAGSMPNPEYVTAKTTLERAKKMGVYRKS